MTFDAEAPGQPFLMKNITIMLDDQVAAKLDECVSHQIFGTQDEIVSGAVQEELRRREAELRELRADLCDRCLRELYGHARQ